MQFIADGSMRGSINKFAGDISGINANETVGFLTPAEKSELFGKIGTQPDNYKNPN